MTDSIEFGEPRRRHLYRTECDVYSAESTAQVLEMMTNEYGCLPGELDPEEPERMAINAEQTVNFYDGAENGRKYPEWVDSEPAARVSFRDGKARVTAQAWVWAKYVVGMVGTENF